MCESGGMGLTSEKKNNATDRGERREKGGRDGGEIVLIDGKGRT
jgi:hypothetical protein